MKRITLLVTACAVLFLCACDTSEQSQCYSCGVSVPAKTLSGDGLCGRCYEKTLEDEGQTYDDGFYDGQLSIVENYVLLPEAVTELHDAGRDDAIEALRDIYVDEALTDYPDIDW